MVLSKVDQMVYMMVAETDHMMAERWDKKMVVSSVVEKVVQMAVMMVGRKVDLIVASKVHKTVEMTVVQMVEIMARLLGEM